MLTLKRDVKIAKLGAQMVLAADIVNACYQNVGVKQCQITSGSDGKHKKGSKHDITRAPNAQLDALDFSTLQVPANKIVSLVKSIALALTSDFDVLYEAPKKPANLPESNYWKSSVPHLHVEYDP